MFKIKRVFTVLQNYCGILEVGIVMLGICVIVPGIRLLQKWYVLTSCLRLMCSRGRSMIEGPMQEDNEYRDEDIVMEDQEEEDLEERMDELAF